MFLNCNRCCLKRFMINAIPVLKVTNYTDLQIYFILQYDTEVKQLTKQSPVFGRDQFYQCAFARTAYNIAFNVINASSQDFICNRTLSGPGRFHFFVIETPNGIQCIED